MKWERFMYTDENEIRGNDRAEVANWRDEIPQLFLSFEARLVVPPARVDQRAFYQGGILREGGGPEAGFPPARPRSCICAESQVS